MRALRGWKQNSEIQFFHERKTARQTEKFRNCVNISNIPASRWRKQGLHYMAPNIELLSHSNNDLRWAFFG